VGGRGGGGFGGVGGASLANTGDYLVTMVVNGKTYKESFRVERVSGGQEDAPQFGQDSRDRSGRVVTTPTPARKKSK